MTYDYALTIAREINLFWKRPKKPWMFVLFVSNRYITIFGHAPFLVYSFWKPDTQSDYNVGHLSTRDLSCILMPTFSFSGVSGERLLIWFLLLPDLPYRCNSIHLINQLVVTVTQMIGSRAWFTTVLCVHGCDKSKSSCLGVSLLFTEIDGLFLSCSYWFGFPWWLFAV